MPNFNLGIGNWDETLKKDLSEIYLFPGSNDPALECLRDAPALHRRW